MKLRELWIWDSEETKFYSSFITGTSLHVCAGNSTVGDIKIDRYTKRDIVADYRYIPVKDKSFDTVICDPPWAKSERLDLGIENWLYELRRVARKRIIIIHNTIFVIKGWKLKQAYAVNAKGLLYKVVQIHEADSRSIDEYVDESK